MLYAIPTYNCNLNCQHCDLHLKKDEYNEEKFIKALNDIEESEITLFGGEPLLYKDRFKKCVETNKITSVSTNLLLLDREYIELFKKYNLNIATSWNLFRFNEKQYKQWLEKLELLEKYDLKCIILITLTDDLLSYNIEKFLQMLDEWNLIKSIDGILFEHLIDDNATQELHIRADEWLCRLHNYWEYDFENLIEKRIKNWDCDCSKIKTLMPNGEIKNGCPQYEKSFVIDKCFNCDLVNICRPCRLQNKCSFPQKLYRKVYG